MKPIHRTSIRREGAMIPQGKKKVGDRKRKRTATEPQSGNPQATTKPKSDLQSAHTYRCALIENQVKKTTRKTNSATQFDSNSLRQRQIRNFRPLTITT